MAEADEGVEVEVALQWRSEVAFTANPIPFRMRWRHTPGGFRAALTRCLNNYIEKAGLAKKAKVPTTGDDAREGAYCHRFSESNGPEILLSN